MPTTTERLTASRLDSVRERLRPIFDRIAEGAVQREQSHTLPREHVRWLVDAGFAALRVPVEYGGDGLSIPELAEVLVELAAADSNLPQIFRGHIAFVEDRLTSPAGDSRDTWLRRFADGEFVGNAWSEVGQGAQGLSQTTLHRADTGWTLNGRKFYTTGSIYADWIDVTARRSDGVESTAIVRAAQTGVTITDDWDGFGQQLTGTGTTVFEHAAVDGENVFAFTERFRYQTAIYQLVLLAVLAGVAKAAERDAAREVHDRQRAYTHGSAALVREDPQVLAVIGEISSAAFVAEATVQRVASTIQLAFETATHRGSAEDDDANVAAEIASAQGQVVLSTLVPQAATRVFDTLGASAVSRSKGLDRHWRNARTVASHNPWIYKAKIVGDWSVNATPPPFIWAIGVATPAN